MAPFRRPVAPWSLALLSSLLLSCFWYDHQILLLVPLVCQRCSTALCYQICSYVRPTTWRSLGFFDLDRQVVDLNWKIVHGVLYTAQRLVSFGVPVPLDCFCSALSSICFSPVRLPKVYCHGFSRLCLILLRCVRSSFLVMLFSVSAVTSFVLLAVSSFIFLIYVSSPSGNS